MYVVSPPKTPVEASEQKQKAQRADSEPPHDILQRSDVFEGEPRPLF